MINSNLTGFHLLKIGLRNPVVWGYHWIRLLFVKCPELVSKMIEEKTLEIIHALLDILVSPTEEKKNTILAGKHTLTMYVMLTLVISIITYF